ncbi:uncharacterized protein LOC141655271 [Silene latifolia]|uniref:uncharacterized protein LOC141655271 n=1 Tax=Silene latifolia TaxID=37657 RepID=UPI003D77DA80
MPEVVKVECPERKSGWREKEPYLTDRHHFGELTTLGIKNAENLAIPSVRNDAAFLTTVVGTAGALAVLAGQLPGILYETQQPSEMPSCYCRIGASLYLTLTEVSLPLLVLAIGSVFLGKKHLLRLLQAIIGRFSAVFPDYQERLARHEAAQFLVGYLLGLPILDYSMDIGKEHVNLVNDKLEKLYIQREAGFQGTRQVLLAASLLKNNKGVHEALMDAMSKKASPLECIKAIEMDS